MEKIQKEQLSLWAIFLLLIVFIAESFFVYENPLSRRLLIVSYGFVVLFGLVLAIHPKHWTLLMLTCILISSMPLLESLLFLPKLHGVDSRTSLVLYKDEGIFTSMGTASTSLFGFIAPLKLDTIKIARVFKY